MPESLQAVRLDAARFSGEIDGRPVSLHEIGVPGGLRVAICSYGAKIVQILVPDRAGNAVDVALGYDSLEALRAGQWSLGAFVGRYANRIAQARFRLEGRQYVLAANDGPHCLHGGPRGSFCRVFEVLAADAASVEMRYVFADGEEGFPGVLDLRVRYGVEAGDALSVRYEALASGAATVASFTTHAFFNLAGHASGEVLGHRLHVPASRFLPVDETLIPTGELRAVRGTPMDFTHPTPLGARIGADDAQLRHGQGYDHFFVLDEPADGRLRLAARLESPGGERAMEVWSTEPGLQLYSGNFIDGRRPRDVGKGGALYRKRGGLCLEPSRFPDAPNHPHFPAAVLRPGERYRGETVYRFPR